MLCKLDFQAARYTMTGEVPSQEGNNHPTLSPMGVFDSADGHVNLAASTDKMFRVFCEIMQADELAANPDYESVAPGQSANPSTPHPGPGKAAQLRWHTLRTHQYHRTSLRRRAGQVPCRDETGVPS